MADLQQVSEFSVVLDSHFRKLREILFDIDASNPTIGLSKDAESVASCIGNLQRYTSCFTVSVE